MLPPPRPPPPPCKLVGEQPPIGTRNRRRWKRLVESRYRRRYGRTQKRKSRRLRLARKIKCNTKTEYLNSVRTIIKRLKAFCNTLLYEMPLHVDTHCIGNVPALPPTVKSLLSKGLNCAIPSSNFGSKIDNSIDEYFRRIRVKHLFGHLNSEFTTPRKFYVKSTNPCRSFGNTGLELEQKQTRLKANFQKRLQDNVREKIHSPISHQEKQALQWLKNQALVEKNIIIKSTDKNLGCAIMGREWYISECLRQLLDPTTYTAISTSNNILNCLKIKYGMHKDELRSLHILLKSNKHKYHTNTEWMLKYITHNYTKDFAIPKFYILPKIHSTAYHSR